MSVLFRPGDVVCSRLAGLHLWDASCSDDDWGAFCYHLVGFTHEDDVAVVVMVNHNVDAFDMLVVCNCTVGWTRAMYWCLA